VPGVEFKRAQAGTASEVHPHGASIIPRAHPE
jgi:hypothetical protein